jgi:hypothetical protein
MCKYIHIQARCNAFEIFEQVTEGKSVKRLIQIKNLFNSIGTFEKIFDTKVRKGDDKLVVKTIVVNPELPFSYT